MRPWTFHITTFGCKVNQYESQAIREAWLNLGGTEVTAPADADVALVNSCAVTARGERDARNALYRLHREIPAARRILTGCAARLVQSTLHDHPALDVTVPVRAKSLLLRHPSEIPSDLPQETVSLPFGPSGFRIGAFRRARPVVKVQDGCSHRCTYCIVPLMRGPSVSRPAPEVLEEITTLLEAGYGEIMLSGINLHHYGRGMPGAAPNACGDFWELLRLLDAALAPRWAGRARLRISSLEPTQLDAHGLDTLCQSRMVCPHVHLSLQHGSRSILRRMGRGHCRPERLPDIVNALRRHWGHVGLGADILMGFPGETEDDVRATLDMVDALGLTYAHVFPFSPRPGTPAAAFDGQLPHREKLARAARVRAAVEERKHAFLSSLMGVSRLRVVLDSALEDDLGPSSADRQGVSEHYAPCRFALPPQRATANEDGRQLGMTSARPLRVEDNVLLVEESPE